MNIPGWFYGHDYMVCISKAEAKKLEVRDPKAGYETLSLRPRTELMARSSNWLYLQNISGQLMLASCTTKIQDWPEIFGVSVFLK